MGLGDGDEVHGGGIAVGVAGGGVDLRAEGAVAGSNFVISQRGQRGRVSGSGAGIVLWWKVPAGAAWHSPRA